MLRIFVVLFFLLKSNILFAQGYDVFGIGIYDFKFDGSSSNYATDLRYEKRFDTSLVESGP